MENNRPYPGTHLFTVRVWVENVGELQEPRMEWRGQVCRVGSGITHTFCGWPALQTLMNKLTVELEGDPAMREKLAPTPN